MASKYELTKTEMQSAFNNALAQFSEGNALASVLSNILDRSYYESNKSSEWKFSPCEKSETLQWIRFEQLPTGDTENPDSYRPKERMQGLLNTLRGLSDKTAFLLIRNGGYTYLYMGIFSKTQGLEAVNQLRALTELNLKGVTVSKVEKIRGWDITEIDHIINSLPCCGVLTGQPSIRRNENENPLQNLDKLTAGFRDGAGVEVNYAVLILAEPAKDSEVKDIINRVHRLKSDLHKYRKYTHTISQGETVGENTAWGAGLTAGAGGIGTGLFALGLTAAAMFTGVGAVALPALSGLGAASAIADVIGLGIHGYYSKGKSKQVTSTNAISVEHVNYSVDYCMNLLDKLVTRLEGGRNQGFWNVGTYILAENKNDVDLVASTLRSIYSGQDTYQEPLRIFNFNKSAEVHQHIKGMSLLSLNTADEIKAMSDGLSYGDSWHIFGKLYESLSTPINTEELSVMMSLPHKDVAGLSIKKDAVEFSTNPPTASKEVRSVELGTILDMGARTGHQFNFDLDRLNRHGLIVGLNGSGKTVTGRNILYGMIKNGIPFLVVDPVKTDYLYWADRYNRKHKGERGFKPITIYAPGIDELPELETPIENLEMNPFKPYAAEGANLNVINHTSQLLNLLRRTLAMGDFLPMLLDEAVYNYIAATLGPEAAESRSLDPKEIKEYPTFSGLKKQVRDLLKDRQYSEENTRNFSAAVETRINNLTRGWKRNFFETQDSTSAEKLFENNVVISLAGVGDNNDKAFLMSMLVQALYEYRVSKYNFDTIYRNRVKAGRDTHNGNFLAHYTVLEEAHRLICAPRPGLSSDVDPQGAIAEKFCEMLSEIREPGEGIMIIDQYPSRLIADAIKNTDVKIIHNLQAADDRQAMASCISLNDGQSRLLATLKKGNAIIGQGDSAMWLQINYKSE